MSNAFYDGIENEKGFEGRMPILGVGSYTVELVNLGFRHSVRQDKDYLEAVFNIVESTNAAFPAGTSACVQIWPAPFNIHKRKLKALVQAFLPGKNVTSKLCDEIIKEDLLAGAKIRVTVSPNGKGYAEPTYHPYNEAA
jgi:hypothetical protein